MSFGRWIKEQAESAADAVTGNVGDVVSAVGDVATQSPLTTMANVATTIPYVGQYAQPVAGVLNNPVVQAVTNPVGYATNLIGGGVASNGRDIVRTVAPVGQQDQSLGGALQNILMINEGRAIGQGIRGGVGMAVDAAQAAPFYLAGQGPKIAVAANQFARNPSVATMMLFGAAVAEPWLKIANTPLENQHTWQGAGAFHIAQTGGQVRPEDTGLPFNYAVKWAHDNPDQWPAIIQVHEQGYDADQDGEIDYTGDRAVWEYYIGQQPMWVRIAADVTNDPWNLTLLIGGVESLLGRAGLNAATTGNIQLQRAIQTTAKTIGWTDDAIAAVLDPTVWVRGASKGINKVSGGRIGEALGPIGTRIADSPAGWLLRESEGSKAQTAASKTTQTVGNVPSTLATTVPDWAVPTNATGTFTVATPPDGIAAPDGAAYVVDPSGAPVPGFDFTGRSGLQQAKTAAENFITLQNNGDTVPSGVLTNPIGGGGGPTVQPQMTDLTTPFPAIDVPEGGITPAAFQQTLGQRGDAIAQGELSVFAPRLGDRRLVTIVQQMAADYPDEADRFFTELGLDRATGNPLVGSRIGDLEIQHQQLDKMYFDRPEGSLARKLVEQKLVYADGTINEVVPAWRGALGTTPVIAPSDRAAFYKFRGSIDRLNDPEKREQALADLVDLALYDAGDDGNQAIRALNSMATKQAKWLKDESVISGRPLIADINRLRKRMKNPDAATPHPYTGTPDLATGDNPLPPPPTRAVPPMTDLVDDWLREGVVDEPTAALLRSTPAGLDAPLIDTIHALERQGLTDRQIRTQIADALRKTATQVPKAERKGRISLIDKTIRFVRDESKASRQRMQYNTMNAIPGSLGDLAGNTMHFWQQGDIGAATAMWRRVLTGGVGEQTAADYFTREHNDLLRGLDLDFVAPDAQKFGAGDDEIVDLRRLAGTRADTRLTRGALKAVGGNPTVMDVRHGFDSLSRNTAREHGMLDALPQAMLNFTEEAQRLGYDLTELMPELRRAAQGRGVQGPYFSPADVRAVTGDETLTKHWRAEIGQAQAAGDAAAKTNFFENAKRTNLDDLLGKVAYFHFWQSRALALQAKNMLRQPRVLGGYTRMMDGALTQAEQENYPDWAKGMLGYYSGPGGFYALTGALQFLVPGAMFLDLANLRDDQTTVQKVMSVLPINPFINAAAAVLGQSDNLPAILGTGRAQTLMRNVADYLGSIGLLPQGPHNDPVSWATEAVLKTVNERADSIPGVETWRPYDPQDGSMDTLASIVWALAEDDFGPSENWTPEQWAEVNDDIGALESGGAGSDRAKAAYDLWAEAKILNVVPQLTTPGGSVLRFGPRDEAMAANKEGDEAAGEQRGYVTASTEARELTTEQNKVDALGTERQKALYQGYSAIVYPDPEADPTDYVQVMGQTITVAQLLTLPEDQRRLIADEWVLENNGTEELDQYWNLRNAAKSQSTLLTTQGQYRDLIDQFASARQFREWAAKEIPTFGQAMRDYEAYLKKDRGLSGEALQNELDAWVNYDSAFLAFTGKQDSRYDDAPNGEGYNFPPPTIGAGSGIGGGGNSVVDRIDTDLTQYGKSMDELKASGMSDFMIQWAQRYGGSAFAIPQLSDETKAYLSWKDRQPPGSDTSTAAYNRWLNDVTPSTQQAPAALR